MVCLLRCVQVKKKMSAEDFLKNNRGINDGADLAPEFMRSLYERIVCNEIQVRRNTSMAGVAALHVWLHASIAGGGLEWLFATSGTKAMLDALPVHCTAAHRLALQAVAEHVCILMRWLLCLLLTNRSRMTWWMLLAPRLRQRRRSAATC